MDYIKTKSDIEKMRIAGKLASQVLDMIEEYSDMCGLSKANTVFIILREYPKLKQAERVRELQAIRKTGGILNAI